MAVTNTNTKETTTEPAVKQYVDYANSQIDEQAILDKYNKATAAQYAVQREQNRQAENAYYNQMYNTQQTAMDTIRQSNAAAVSSGASRGVQAAQELSALLGLETNSIESATELAQANRQTAQEETAAMLQNVLSAAQEAQSRRQNLISSGIEAEQVEVNKAANETAQQANTETHNEYMRNLHASDPDAYYQQQAKDNNATDFENMTPEQFTTNVNNGTLAISEITKDIDYSSERLFTMPVGGGMTPGTITEADSPEYTGTIRTSFTNLYRSYGLSEEDATTALNNLVDVVKKAHSQSRSNTIAQQAATEFLQSQFKLAYAMKYNK